MKDEKIKIKIESETNKYQNNSIIVAKQKKNYCRDEKNPKVNKSKSKLSKINKTK